MTLSKRAVDWNRRGQPPPSLSPAIVVSIVVVVIVVVIIIAHRCHRPCRTPPSLSLPPPLPPLPSPSLLLLPLPPQLPPPQPWLGHHASSGAHLGLFGGKKKSPQNKNFENHPNHLTSINSNHHDDGNVLAAQELLDALLAKIRWGILTP